MDEFFKKTWSYLKNKFLIKPRPGTRLVFFLFFLAVFALFLVIHRIQGGPQPHRVSVSVFAPPPTALATNLQPHMASIRFGESVAQLGQIGKKVANGIHIEPKVQGAWSWADDRNLHFDPKKDWPAGQKYRVTLDKSLFPNRIKLETYKVDFTTAPFSYFIRDFDFYINPLNPDEKQAVAALEFSHPVDAADLEKRITLEMERKERVFRNTSGKNFTLSMDPAFHQRVAYIRSVSLNLPEHEGYMKLTIAKGVRTAAGEARFPTPMERTHLIPDRYSLFQIKSVTGDTVVNTRDEPEQVLTVETSLPVRTADLQKNLALHVLPLDKPATRLHPLEKNHAWNSPGEITDAILALSEEIKTTLVPAELEFSKIHKFKFKADDRHDLYLRIKQGVEGVGGFLLKEDFASCLPCPKIPKEIKIMHEGALLALSGERKLSIYSRNLPGIEYHLGRILSGQINHLVTQSDGDIKNPCFENYLFGEENISESFIEHQGIQRQAHGESAYSAFDFSKYVLVPNNDSAGEPTLRHGLFFLTARGWDPERGPEKEPETRDRTTNRRRYEPTERREEDLAGIEDHRFILLTDLGMIVKDNADGSHDVFVQSIKTENPVNHAAVEVLGKNGVTLLSRETGEDGHVAFPNLQDFTHEKQPVAWLVEKGEDLSFLPFGRQDRKLNLSRFDIGGRELGKPDDLDAFVFTDRGIYRPGDRLHGGLIVKRGNWKGPLEGVPLETRVTDPRGMDVQVRKISLPGTGFMEWDFQTRETSLTGNYRMDVFLVGKRKEFLLLGSTGFRVEEFLPDRLKIKVRLNKEQKEGWVSPENMKGLVSLQNLYGAPSEGHRITGKMTLNPGGFYFGRYPDHTFFDPLLTLDRKLPGYTEDLKGQTADEKGNAVFDFNLERFARATWNLTFFAQGFELEGGRCVADSTGILVSPAEYLVGFKPDGELGFVNMGGKRSVEFIAVNPRLDPTAVGNLKVKLVEIKYVSVLTKQPNGSYAYESTRKEAVVREEPFSIGEKGSLYSLPTENPGEFEARVFDDGETMVARVPFTVAGQSNLTRSLEKNTELKIHLPKSDFEAGEEIQVQITSPYTGAGLITIEGDKVYAHQWFKTRTTSSVQTIRVPQEVEGNAYINVAFVRAPDSKEVFMSPLGYAVAPFKVNREKRHVHIDLDIPEKARPGEPFIIGYKTDRPAKIMVYAVDEGILQAAHYSTPDPLEYYFRKRALQVQTMQILDLILPEYSIVKQAAATGGDAGEDILSRNLNPFKRKRDLPVVFWSGILDADSTRKQAAYQIPDYFSGTFRVMAVAATPDAVGNGQKKSFIKGPFVINPNLPAFVAPGDLFDVSAVISNQVEGSGTEARVALEASVSDNLELVKQPAGPVSIPEGKEGFVHYLVRARDLPGNADLMVKASLGDQKGSRVSHLSIRPAVPFMTSVKCGYFEGSSKEVEVERRLYTTNRKMQACISPLPMVFAQGLDAYLQNYSYYCTEQLVSKAFPSLVLSEQEGMGFTRAQAMEKFQETLDILRNRQDDKGAFGYWRAAETCNLDFPSVHAVHFLTEAGEQGFPVPEDLLTRGLGRLETMATANVRDLGEARLQAFAIYLLTRNGIVTTSYLLHLRDFLEKNHPREWKDDFTGLYMAGTYALLKQDEEGEKILEDFHFRKAREDFDSRYHNDFFSTLSGDAQYIYLLSKHFPQRLKKLPPEDVMSLVDLISDAQFNTLSAAYSILALQACSRVAGENPPGELSISEAGVDQKAAPLALPAGLYPSVDFSENARKLRFSGRNRGTFGLKGMFYQVAQAGFDRDLPTRAVSEGIEVQREFRDKYNHIVDRCKRGDELTVHLKSRTLDKSYLTHVALVDLLPGGFEVETDSLRGGGFPWIEWVDGREDRVIFFGSFEDSTRELVYKIRATNRGDYVVPPSFAESMYNPKVRHLGVPAKIYVEDDQ